MTAQRATEAVDLAYSQPNEAVDAQPGASAYVSIVMPCLNEEETISTCVFKARAWLRQSKHSGEIVVVDNGSTDSSAYLAASAGARVVREEERGYGAALRRGFAEARGEWIVMGDADDTYEWSDLDALVEPLDADFDLVVGDRYAGGIAPGAMTWSHRYLGTPVLSWLLKLFAGMKVGDSQCGLRAFKRQALDTLDLRTSGMELASEMILKASRRGLKVASVPVPYGVRQGEAKLNTFRDGWRHLRFMLLASPNYLFTMPGLFLTALGLLTLGLSLTGPGIQVAGVTWQPVFAGTIFLVAGINAVLLGFASQLYTTRRGLTVEGAILRFYRRHLGFEAFVVIGLALGAAGVLLDVLLAIAGGSSIRLELAAVAQALIITSTNLVLVGALCGLLEE